MIAALALQQVTGTAAAPCPGRIAALADSARQAYRSDRIPVAAARFAAADSLCPGLPDIQIGLGFVALRQSDVAAAQRRFDAVLKADSLNADGWYGIGLARQRQGKRELAIAAFRRALRIAPGYADAKHQLDALGYLGETLPPARRPAAAQVPARTHGERFEIRQAGSWVPFYVKGVNLGAARPGKFAADFPTDDSTYTSWLSLMAGAHANVVRLYTILPPAFYRALKRWNDGHPTQALWLVHGVWAEEPPADDYDDTAWKTEFHDEMHRVIDLLHGHAIIPARLGHASGRYTVDVSDHVLAFIIGREWEPFTIHHYNERRAGQSSYSGQFLAVDSGTPSDVWMAEQCDYLLSYEWDTYHAQRPIAYTNWPTLDPLHHPTEPTLEEEAALRDRLGLPPLKGIHEYDNDDQSLDAMLVRTTAADVAGYFASYHTYPYYPDFMDYDSTYGLARDSSGVSHYIGYLRDLKRHHAGRPLLISEYGVPSSRGLAHLQPEGMHHGGHDEQAMADIDVRLTREIREAGLAGGILFAWIDEWFKHNWVVIDLEVPADHTRLWHNVMDAEQNYGLLGQYSGAAERPEPGGDAARWRALKQLEGNDSLALRVGSDESYLYLALDARAPLGTDVVRYLVGLDTYRADRGEFRLPGVPGIGVGVEFYLDLSDSTSGQLFVTRSYNPYIQPRAGMGPTGLDPFYNVLCTADSRSDTGQFDSMFVTTNRFRITRAGRRIPATGVDRGLLRFGRVTNSSLVDWFIERTADRSLVEVRLPWGLLNVTDPSTRTVLTAIHARENVATAATDGFRFVVAALDRRDNHMAEFVPASTTYIWPTWEDPQWHERLKPAYYAMRDLWGTW
ncbi:MAG TPA: tetratricopeptide repeat protein [Gemmatimonadales bacterium]|nr:tetratricopeptide repeat protein [Gemmatimonadales bacterium]